jgi:predicted metal-binding protein
MPPRKKVSINDKDLEKYCKSAIKGGATHAKQIHPGTVVTAPWVPLKCQFGCPGYSKGYCCPPHTPTPDRTREILDAYQRAILFHIEVPHMPQKEKHYRKFFDMLVDLEGRLFKDGFYKAFVFLAGPCRLCKKCSKLEDNPCKFLSKARPCMEACGMDVFQTARNNGFFIKTLSKKTETNNEYCLMLVD